MRASTRYALSFAAAVVLCLAAFPWLLRLAAPLAAACADAVEALLRAALGPR